MRQEKEMLNTAFADVADQESIPSERVIMNMADLKLKQNSYETVSKQVKEMIEAMWPMKTTFVNNKESISKYVLHKDETDNESLNKLQDRFRALLRKFNYKSNNIGQVSLMFEDKNSNYLYLPQAQVEQYDEHLRSVSSASDFVRSLWAFYLSLMMIGPGHPGFLVFDEPCQHSIREADLKKLFETCSNVNGQVILFCSSEPKTEETVNAEKGYTNVKKTNIQVLLKDIEESKYQLYQMKVGEKTIQAL